MPELEFVLHVAEFHGDITPKPDILFTVDGVLFHFLVICLELGDSLLNMLLAKGPCLGNSLFIFLKISLDFVLRSL